MSVALHTYTFSNSEGLFILKFWNWGIGKLHFQNFLISLFPITIFKKVISLHKPPDQGDKYYAVLVHSA